MSGERVAAESSRLLIPPFPPPSSPPPLTTTTTTTTTILARSPEAVAATAVAASSAGLVVESETTEAAVAAAAAAVMGDVLTREHRPDSLSCSSNNSTSGSSCVEEQLEPAPPPPPALDEIIPVPYAGVAPLLRENIELKSDELTIEVVMNSEDDTKNITVNTNDGILNNGNIIENGISTTYSGNSDESLEKKEECSTKSCTMDDLCECENEDCQWKKRDLSTDDLQEMLKLRHLGVNLRQYIRYTFHWFMDTSGFSANPSSSTLPQQLQDLDSIENFVELRKSVVLLYEKVPYQLFMWLVGQAQEFVIGVKVQLLTVLYDRSIDNLPEVFITKLLDGYEALLATAVHISDLLEPLQNELFSKVNLTWGYINKSLYQNYVFSDPLIQNTLHPFLNQLKECAGETSKYKYLLDRYFAFNDEISKIGSLCPEIERLIDKYNAEQMTGSVMKKIHEDFERFKTKLKLDLPLNNEDFSNKLEFIKETDDSNVPVPDNDDLFYTNSYIQACSLPHAVEIQSMFNDWKKSPQERLADLVESLTLSSTPEKTKECVATNENPCLEKNIKEGINKSVSCEKQACKCNFNSSIVDPTFNLKQEKSQNLKNNEISYSNTDNLKADPAVVVVNDESNENSALSRYVLSKQNKAKCKEALKLVSKSSVAQTSQIQIRHSTTQTPNALHNQGHVHRHHHQGRCSSHSHLHGSLSNAVIKSSGPHRTYVGHNNHPSAAVSCHKQQHIVEHIKRLSTIDLSPGENGDCSDSASSHEDSCSVTNSPTPRDSSRHCDCCYCEVFGHGVPSVAPVSRNYNEMRERLRQLLSKKKAKICKTTCNPHAKSAVEVSSSSSSLSSSSSTSSTITNIDLTNLPNPASRSNTPNTATYSAAPNVIPKAITSIKTATPSIPVKFEEDLWNIDAAVEFIEGTHGGKKDEKKAAKKARQKQRKIDEKLQKQKEEDERLKLIELQKKTPEVTITVVNPQKQISLKKIVPQQKLPEVSILPAVAPSPTKLTISKQTNALRKKSVEVTNNKNKNSNKNKVLTETTITKVTENSKKKPVNVDKSNETFSLNQSKSKTSEKVNEIVTQTTVDDDFNNLSALTKKERKKLRREMKKQEELKNELENKQTDNQLQIVTIKRIMESNNAEPTVTITLKGQTPAEDKVLFTLVNGQTKDSIYEKSSTQTSTTGKKKKNKENNSVIQSQQNQSTNKAQLRVSNNITKTEKNQKQDSKNKQQQHLQQGNKEKSKANKQQEEQKARQQQNTAISETKNPKTKTEKKKNVDNKENIMKQVTNENTRKQENSITIKKPNKVQNNVVPSNTQKNQQQQSNTNSNNKNKSSKNQNQSQNQKKCNNINQNNLSKTGKSNSNSSNNNNNNNNNQNITLPKIDNPKNSKAFQNTPNKQKQNMEMVQIQKKEQNESLQTNNFNKDTNKSLSSISIENLKLPPGITITKVDVPVKPLPLKSNSASTKSANNSSKQTTIIAAPMSGIQSSNYGNSQGAGNVIVVDTGRLKQDLAPKNGEKEALKDPNNQSSTSKKKKKKKNKNSSVNNNEKSSNVQLSQNTKLPQQYSNDYVNVEPARILHNPSTNMVTIRNPAFGPPPPKVESNNQQAAIIKVGENGMVTIRSPALQQAINAGLQPPPKPDFIIKGGAVPNDSKPINNSFMNSTELSGAMKASTNGMQLSTDFAELRRRLVQQSDNERTTASSTLFNNGLSSIQISKVTNGQSPNIPDSGINLKGTSVTLTKIRSTESHNPHQQQQQYTEESKGVALNGSASTKNRKKKKRGNASRQGGDDWNLVESVFTPKDIDLEDGEMDETERELEAFKRFCLQSVPPPRKEKVNLNIKDIVLKKKSSSSASTTAAAASAATTAAAVVAAI